jgi:CRP-like cAMP-binding protein
MRLAHWRDAKAGEKLIVKGQEVTQLYLLYSGEANVYFDDTYDVDIGDGRFLGELSFSLFEKARTDVTIKSKSRLIYWNQDDLWDLLERNPAMRVHFSELINEDLVRKMVM